MLIAWILSLVAVFIGGYHYRRTVKRIEKIETEVKKKIDRPKEEPESLVVDPLDPVQEAQFEMEQMEKRLNP